MCRADSIRVERATVQQQQQELENQTAITREKERQFHREPSHLSSHSLKTFNSCTMRWLVWVRQVDQGSKSSSRGKTGKLLLLLEKETRLLQNIDLSKRQAHYLNCSDRVGQFFHRISKPRKWQISDGSFVDVMTPYSLRSLPLRAVTQ